MIDKIYEEWLKRVESDLKDKLIEARWDHLNILLPQDQTYVAEPSSETSKVISYITLDFSTGNISTSGVETKLDEEVIEKIKHMMSGVTKKEVTSFEHDDDGNIYGYKILVKERGEFLSPNFVLTAGRQRFQFLWVNGKLSANKTPSYNTPYGIHGVKKLKDLLGWYDLYRGHYLRDLVFVKVVIFGVVVETEYGFRAEFAEIVKTLDMEKTIMEYGYNGHWKGY